MQRRNSTTPGRQASGVARKNNHSLTHDEWIAVWKHDGWILVAGFAAFFVIITLIETGVFA